MAQIVAAVGKMTGMLDAKSENDEELVRKSIFLDGVDVDLCSNNADAEAETDEPAIVNESTSDEGGSAARYHDRLSDCKTSSSSDSTASTSPTRFSIIDIPSKVRASIFPRKPAQKKKKKYARSSTADTSSPSVTADSLLANPEKVIVEVKKPRRKSQDSEKFKHFWDEKLRLTMDRFANNLNKPGEDKDVFHLLLKLYAHQDIVEELYSSYETNADEFEFYIPQLCTFLLHGNYAKQHQLECFLMSRSGESLPFAHRLTWFLRSFCEDAKSYQSEYLSVVSPSPDQENSDLLTAIEMRAGVPAVLMNNGLCVEEVSASNPANLRRRRSSVFAIDQGLDPTVLATDETFADHLNHKRETVVYEARTEEGNSQQISLFTQTPAFVDALTNLADKLIPIPLLQRNEELRKGLGEIQDQLLPSDVLYLPIGNSYHRVKAIQVSECFTFSTKERVPYFLCVEVLDYSVQKSTKKRRKVRHKNQSRGFLLKLPFKKTGSSVDVVPLTDMDSIDAALNQVGDNNASNEQSTEIISKPTASKLPQIVEERASALERPSVSSSIAPSFLSSFLGGSGNKVDISYLDPDAVALTPLDVTPSTPLVAAPSTPKEPLDGEDGDDEKENETKETKEEAVEQEEKKPDDEQQQRMGQWSLPRVRRRSKSRTTSAASRSGGQFDSFYSSWFSRKHKREEDAGDDADSFAENTTEASADQTNVSESTVSLGDDSAPMAEDTALQATSAPSAEDLALQAVLAASAEQDANQAAAFNADIDSSDDDLPKPKTRNRDLSVSLDFTDSDAWKVNFDLEDVTDDDEPEAETAEHDHALSDDHHSDVNEDEDDKPMIVFRERWSEKEARIRKESQFGDHPGWRLLPVIVKSNDDLRQEQFAAQLIAQCDRIFREYSLPLSLRPYNVIATSAKTGLIEAVPDTVSLDSLKRNDPDYTTLLDFYYRLHGPKDSIEFARARRNFVESLAAYSILCYVFQIKDRHNGNILLDTDGHLIHIDFGFFLTNSPGSNLNFERAPFKLTDEFVELMGGARSSTFRYFRSLCIRAYLALRRNMEKIVLLVEMMLIGNSDLPCFAGGKRAVIDGLRARLKPGVRTSTCQVFVNQLIDRSINNWRTRWYDKYQRACLGIL